MKITDIYTFARYGSSDLMSKTRLLNRTITGGQIRDVLELKVGEATLIHYLDENGKKQAKMIRCESDSEV